MSTTYLTFLQTKAHYYLPCDPLAEKLLELIALAEKNTTPLTVTEAMFLNLGSPATLHRKLDQLRELGLVEQTFKGQNRRTKYLVTTGATRRHFEKLSEAMDRIMGVPA